jgi:hypothetical protein
MKSSLFRTVLAAAFLAASCFSPAMAAPPVAGQAPMYQYQGTATVTPASTFATTSYADLAGSSITLAPTKYDPTTAGRSALATPTADLIKVTWSLNAIKATATTMTCGPYINGALVAAAVHTLDFAGKNTQIGGVWVTANTVVGNQTIKIQCKSGDTNIGTVNFGQITVEELVF